MKKAIYTIGLLLSIVTSSTANTKLLYNANKPYDGANGKIEQITTFAHNITLIGNKITNVSQARPIYTVFYDENGQRREGINFDDAGKPGYFWKEEYDKKGLLLRREGFSTKKKIVNVQKLIHQDDKKFAWVLYTENQPSQPENIILYLDSENRIDRIAKPEEQTKVECLYDENHNKLNSITYYPDNSKLIEKYKFDPDGKEMFSYTQISGKEWTVRTQYTKFDRQGNWIEKIEYSNLMPRIYTRKIKYVQ